MRAGFGFLKECFCQNIFAFLTPFPEVPFWEVDSAHLLTLTAFVFYMPFLPPVKPFFHSQLPRRLIYRSLYLLPLLGSSAARKGRSFFRDCCVGSFIVFCSFRPFWARLPPLMAVFSFETSLLDRFIAPCGFCRL